MSSLGERAERSSRLIVGAVLPAQAGAERPVRGRSSLTTVTAGSHAPRSGAGIGGCTHRTVTRRQTASSTDSSVGWSAPLSCSGASISGAVAGGYGAAETWRRGTPRSLRAPPERGGDAQARDRLLGASDAARAHHRPSLVPCIDFASDLQVPRRDDSRSPANTRGRSNGRGQRDGAGAGRVLSAGP